MPFKHYVLLLLNHLTQQFNLRLVQLVLFSTSQAEKMPYKMRHTNSI